MELLNYEYEGINIELWQEEDPENPRDWEENLGIFALFHGKYTLAYEWELVSRRALQEDCRSWGDVINTIKREQKKAKDPVVAWLPVKMYDHSGVWLSDTIERGWFHASWDSGQVGFIFVTRSQVHKLLGWKRLSAAHINKLWDALRQEIKVYGAWLNGDNYGYTVGEDDLEGGFITVAEAQAAAESLVDQMAVKI